MMIRRETVSDVHDGHDFDKYEMIICGKEYMFRKNVYN